MNHTPGPWYAVEYGGFWNIQTDDCYSESDVLDVEKVGNEETTEANAKLCAAAPDLLDGLKRCLSNSIELRNRYRNDAESFDPGTTEQRMCLDNVRDVNADIELIKAAIKKATV
jgi:hypothetical protein